MANNTESKVTFKVFNQDFNKAMGEMKQESSKLRQEFYLQELQLKENGSETDKLSLKLDYLGQAQQMAEQKVEATAKQLQKAKELFGENSKEASTLSRQLNEAKIAEQKLHNEISQANNALSDQATAADKAADALGSTGEKLKEVGGTATATVTPGVLAVGAGALKVAGDFDNAQGKMQAQLGLTAEEAEKLGDSAQSVWEKGFGESINEVSDQMSIVKQNIQGISDEDLPKVTEQALILRDAFGAEVTESTRTASVMMKNFGIDSSTAMDLMTVGFQRGGNFSDELLDTMREYSPQFKALGYDAEGMTSILIAGAESGAFNLDKIGDAAKESFLRIGDGSKSSHEALKGLGLDSKQVMKDINSGGEGAQKAFMAVTSAIAGVKDPAKQAELAVALMGTPIEDLGPEFKNFFSTVNTDLGNVEGATDRAGDALKDTFGMQVSEAIRQLQLALLPLGEVLIDFALMILPKVSAMAQVLAEWFSKLSPVGQTLTIVFGVIAAALGPLLIAFGFIAQAIGALIPVLVSAWGWLSKLGPVFTIIRTALAFLTGPIGILIASITLLAIIIYNNWESIKVKTIEAWTSIKNWMSSAWDSIKNGIGISISAIKLGITTTWNGIKNFFTTMFTSLKNAFIATWNGIKLIVTTVLNAVKNVITLIWNGIKLYFTTMFNIYKTIFTTGWNVIKTIITTVFTAIKKIVTTVWDGIKMYFTNVFNLYKTIITSAWNTIKSTTSSIFNGIKSIVTGVWNTITSSVNSAVSNIKNGVVNGFNNAKNTAISAMNNMRSGISSAIETIKGFFPKMMNNIINAIKGINLKSIGSDLLQGLLNGINGKAKDLYNKATEIANGIKNKIKNALKISSPSKVMYQFGAWTGEGLADGIESMKKSLQKSASKMAHWVTPEIPEVSTIGMNHIKVKTKNIADNLATAVSKAVNAQIHIHGDVYNESMIDKLTNQVNEKLGGLL
jgi:TP901 family phage tail tape measure protein